MAFGFICANSAFTPCPVLQLLVPYLLFLPRRWLSFQDAGVHGLDVLDDQAEELVTEAEHKLLEKAGQRVLPDTRHRQSAETALHQTSVSFTISFVLAFTLD